MKNFRTVIKFSGSPEKFDHRSSILMIGSCFAENIGEKLLQNKFNIALNPFGILYNPASIARSVNRIISGGLYQLDELCQNHELWCSFDHHGRFSDTDAERCLQGINDELSEAHRKLHRLDWLIITFGTAWIYSLKGTGEIVANCHKLPSDIFIRRRMDPDEIVAGWNQVVASLRQVNPDINILFTVSPVRHLRDGAHENQISKSTLLLAIDRICREHPRSYYFPAYEIMLDDLRDYRFYDTDMIHPNSTAIDYIWDMFCNTYISEHAIEVMKEIEKIVNASKHRPIHRTTEIQKFTTAFLEKIELLQQKMPYLDFGKEISMFQDNLK